MVELRKHNREALPRLRKQHRVRPNQARFTPARGARVSAHRQFFDAVVQAKTKRPLARPSENLLTRFLRCWDSDLEDFSAEESGGSQNNRRSLVL